MMHSQVGMARSRLQKKTILLTLLVLLIHNGNHHMDFQAKTSKRVKKYPRSCTADDPSPLYDTIPSRETGHLHPGTFRSQGNLMHQKKVGLSDKLFLPKCPLCLVFSRPLSCLGNDQQDLPSPPLRWDPEQLGILHMIIRDVRTSLKNLRWNSRVPCKNRHNEIVCNCAIHFVLICISFRENRLPGSVPDCRMIVVGQREPHCEPQEKAMQQFENNGTGEDLLRFSFHVLELFLALTCMTTWGEEEHLHYHCCNWTVQPSSPTRCCNHLVQHLVPNSGHPDAPGSPQTCPETGIQKHTVPIMEAGNSHHG